MLQNESNEKSYTDTVFDYLHEFLPDILFHKTFRFFKITRRRCWRHKLSQALYDLKNATRVSRICCVLSGSTEFSVVSKEQSFRSQLSYIILT